MSRNLILLIDESVDKNFEDKNQGILENTHQKDLNILIQIISFNNQKSNDKKYH